MEHNLSKSIHAHGQVKPCTGFVEMTVVYTNASHLSLISFEVGIANIDCYFCNVTLPKLSALLHYQNLKLFVAKYHTHEQMPQNCCHLGLHIPIIDHLDPLSSQRPICGYFLFHGIWVLYAAWRCPPWMPHHAFSCHVPAGRDGT